ncbi:MAG: haloacid dehalogenase [Actinomycetota bacterium]|nr:haloacid dehalogenase [Actinomycetota bacterium]
MKMNLEKVGEIAEESLEREHRAREKAIMLSRQVIRKSANSIRALHRNEEEKFLLLKEEAQKALIQAQQELEPHPRIYYSGIIQDAEKEFAEACLTRAIINFEDLPGPEELRVGVIPYVKGLGEAAGEARRRVLDLIRSGELSQCEQMLGVMEEIHALLSAIDYPEALTGGLRRTGDMVRGVVERTRSDLTFAQTAKTLEKRISALDKKLNSG